MYNIAQQMVQSDTYLKSGTATATATTVMKGMPGYPSGTYPPLPFDPSIFSDPAFTLSVEQAAAAALGVASPPPGQPPRGPLPQTNVVLLNEFGDGEHKLGGDDYCSEDEVDGGNFEDDDLDAFDLHPHPARPPALPSVPASLPDPVAQVVLSYGEHIARAAAHPTLVASESVPATVAIGETPEHIGGDDSAGLKGKKKKHSKEGTDAPAEAPVAAVPNAAARGETRSADSAPGSTPEKDGRRPTGGVEATLRHPLSANAMPARKENLSANPPPSSRAQGKQPMAYAPTSTAAATTTTTNGQQAARTARAASKAPMPAHNYNHSHHHPSPPSSNASAPNKSRTAAPSGSNKNPPSNNKIWSTSSTEERERIKEFWLGLGEDERRNLVKIEKDTVLKKMKEQQKHNCSCAVCGRKRSVPVFSSHIVSQKIFTDTHDSMFLLRPCLTIGSNVPPSAPLHVSSISIVTRSKKNSRYCMMLITRSWNGTQIINSATSPRAALYHPHLDLDHSLAASSSIRMALSSDTPRLNPLVIHHAQIGRHPSQTVGSLRSRKANLMTTMATKTITRMTRNTMTTMRRKRKKRRMVRKRKKRKSSRGIDVMPVLAGDGQ